MSGSSAVLRENASKLIEELVNGSWKIGSWDDGEYYMEVLCLPCPANDYLVQSLPLKILVEDTTDQFMDMAKPFSQAK